MYAGLDYTAFFSLDGAVLGHRQLVEDSSGGSTQQLGGKTWCSTQQWVAGGEGYILNFELGYMLGRGIF